MSKSKKGTRTPKKLTGVKIPKKVLEQRRRRPKFAKQESWRYKRLSESWRRPKGIDSRMRKRKKGAPPLAGVGYRSPRAFRNLHPSGMEDVLVHNLEEIKQLNPERQAARIASKVGRRKRFLIYEAAKDLGIKVLNPPVREEPLEAEETLESTEEEEQ